MTLAHETEIAAKVVTSSIPVWAILVPLLGAILVHIAGKKSEKLRNATAITISTITFILIASMYPIIITAETQIEYNIQTLMISGMKFWVDPTSFLFALITSFVWMLATIYSVSYMSHEHAQNRYYFFLILTLAADIGVLLTGDLFSLFIFFEMLSLSSFILVIHEETPEAMAAGKKYLFMGILGGLSLLLGTILIYIYTDTLAIAPLMESGLATLSPSLRYLIAALMVLGFGVKAGMFPVHVWLPAAHPIAPSPASALLSGIMVKAGIYGIIRTLLLIFSPTKDHALWGLTTPLGYAMIWIGVYTMFMGMVLALLQDNLKRLLAYSTVSQIGYIIFGIGISLYMGFEGAAGLAGALYHVVNHALFKSTLFLVAGAIVYSTHELDMNKLGGLWKKMPLTFGACIIASLGIGGIPFFNGYVSKTLLHEGIIEAFAIDPVLRIAEILFVITSGGTIAYYLKMISLTFLGKESETTKNVKEVPMYMIVPMYVMSALIVIIGLFPHLLLDKIIVPALKVYTFDLRGIEHLKSINFWSPHPFIGVGISMMISGVIFAVAVKEGLLTKQITPKFGVDYWYGQAVSGFMWFCKIPGVRFDTMINQGYESTTEKMMEIAAPATKLDDMIDQGYVRTGESLLTTIGTPAEDLDKVLDESYEKSSEEFVKLFGPRMTKLDSTFDQLYIKKGDEYIQLMGQSNINFKKANDHVFVKKEEGFIEVYAPPSEEKFLLFGKYQAHIPSLGEKDPFIKSRDIFFEFTNHAAAFDLFVIDGFVNLQGKLAWVISRSSDLFDYKIVDGTVNWIGDVLHNWAGTLRKPETGIIHDYTSGIVLGVIIIGLIAFIA